jgi:hypothetical protein
LLTAVAALGYGANRYQFRIKAVAWHVLHGDSFAVAGYRIAVPSHWFVEELASDDVQLWNVRTGESIWVRSFPKPANFTLASWSDLVQKRLNDPKNPIVGRREILVADEPFVCFERDFAVVLPPTVLASTSERTIHMPSVECTSAGPLDVKLFAGLRAAPQHDYSEFYSILGSIQKTSR